MRWLKSQSPLRIPPDVRVLLSRKALEKYPNDANHFANLADASADCGNFSDAAGAYETAARLAPADFEAWPTLARCYVQLDLPEAALDACHRAELLRPSANIHFQRGRALRKLGRLADAQRAFLQAAKAPETHLEALAELFAPMVRNPDGTELLELCEELSQPYEHTPLVRSHRAIALSRLGRIEEALQIVDLDRHVARIPFDPPSHFGGIEKFNRQLTDDILADRSRDMGGNSYINYAPPFQRSQALLALREFIKSAIESYLDEARDRRLRAGNAGPAKGRFLVRVDNDPSRRRPQWRAHSCQSLCFNRLPRLGTAQCHAGQRRSRRLGPRTLRELHRRLCALLGYALYQAYRRLARHLSIARLS